MPVLKVICHQNQFFLERTGVRKYQDDAALDDVISYCMDAKKTPRQLMKGYGVNLSQPAYEMRRLAESYGKDKGLRLRHMILSFSAQEIKRFRFHVYDSIAKIADYTARYYAGQYQILHCIHEDSNCLHVHFVMNTVNYQTGKKHAGKKDDYYNFQHYLRTFLAEYYNLPLIVVQDC